MDDCLDDARSRRRTPSAAALASALLISAAGLSAPASSSAQEKTDEGSAPAKKSPAAGPVKGDYLGLGAGLYFENSRREGEQTRGNETTDESVDYSADNIFNGSVWYLKRLGPRLRAGLGLHYFGTYQIKPEPPEDEQQDGESDEPEAFGLGQMVTPFARIEWVVPVLDQAQAVLGAEAGPTILFPDDEFRRTIESMKDENISVSTAPRLGVDIAPMVGARYEIDDRLALRADFSVHWQRLFLFSVDDTVEGVDVERSWTAKVLRYNLGLAMEVQL